MIKIDEAFWSKVDVRGPDECWLWTGSKSTKGYGRWQGRAANRWALENRLGRPLANKEFACHSCDNPPCVNPNHLWPGTHKQNMQDMAAKRRSYGQRLTHCKRGHPFDDENVRRPPAQPQQRQCRTCRREAMREFKKLHPTPCSLYAVGIDGRELHRGRYRTAPTAVRAAWKKALREGLFTADQAEWFAAHANVDQFGMQSEEMATWLSSGVRGVRLHKPSNRWRASITIDHTRLSLGEFKNQEDAIRARKEAELKFGVTYA